MTRSSSCLPGRWGWGAVTRAALLLFFIAPWSAGASRIVISEDFASDPMPRGWRSFGQTNLFAWDTTNQTLSVTWDSSRTNSYFHRPLGTVLTKREDFSFSFSLRLRNVAAGVNPAKPSTFQLAIALINLADATRTNFFRGAGVSATYGPRNAVEFDYFPDSESGFGETVSPTVISSNNQFASVFNFPVALTTNDWFQVTMRFTSSNRTLATTITRNGAPFDSITPVILSTNFTDFRVDHFAVCSFSDAGQDPLYGGSLLAHGDIDDVTVTVPWLPVEELRCLASDGLARVEFLSRTNWSYTLQRSTSFGAWNDASAKTGGTGALLLLADTNSPSEGFSLYRVKAERP